jgi:hypothetical protein
VMRRPNLTGRRTQRHCLGSLDCISFTELEKVEGGLAWGATEQMAEAVSSWLVKRRPLDKQGKVV